MAQKLKITPELSEGAAPEAVRVEVTQGAEMLRSVDVPPGQAAEVTLDEGDYTVRTQALVPAGEPVQIALAVPVRLVVTPVE